MDEEQGVGDSCSSNRPCLTAEPWRLGAVPLCGCLCPRSLSGGLAGSSNQLQPPSSQAALTGLCEQQPVFREGLVLAPSLPASQLAL